MKATCRTQGGFKIEVQVLDLSQVACMIDCRAWSPKPGECIWVKMEGLEALPASVIWLEDGLAGLAFETMLHEAVHVRLTSPVRD